MNKKTAFLTCLAVLSVAALTGCGEEGDSTSDRKTYTYTVTFYDDSATPKKVGYAYVAEGEKAIIHKMNDSDAYDYVSRSTDPIPFGTRNVFDSFKGTYDASKPNKKGETVEGAVDLSNIKNDCDVYANFKNVALTYRVSFKNGTTNYENYDGSTFEWGTFASLPATDPTTDSEWGYDTSFKGYTFNDTVTDLITKENASSAKFLHGEGAPTSATLYDQNSSVATATTGSFYEDTANMDFYVYSGSWSKAGNFKDTTSPTVIYLSKFNHNVERFTVNFYTDFTKSTLLKSLELDYASSVSFDNSTKTITGKSEGQEVSFSFASLGATPVYWSGVYSSDASVPEKYRGQPITNHATSDQKVPVAAPTDFWPVFD